MCQDTAELAIDGIHISISEKNSILIPASQNAQKLVIRDNVCAPDRSPFVLLRPWLGTPVRDVFYFPCARSCIRLAHPRRLGRISGRRRQVGCRFPRYNKVWSFRQECWIGFHNVQTLLWPEIDMMLFYIFTSSVPHFAGEYIRWNSRSIITWYGIGKCVFTTITNSPPWWSSTLLQS